MKHLIFLVVLFFSLNVHSQQVPEHRIYDWSKAATAIDSAELPILHVADYGISGKDSSDLSNDFQELINMLHGNKGGIIYIPQGDYFLSSTLQLKSGVQLIGEGATTRLHFNTGEAHAIRASGQSLPWNLRLKESAKRKDSFIVTQTASTVRAGDLIKLGIENHEEAYSDWAKNSVAQIVKVLKVKGDSIFLNEKLRLDLSNDHLLSARVKPARNMRISCLSILNESATEGQKSNIRFDYVHNSEISGIQSFKGNFAHVDLRNCHNVSVTSSYFKNAHKHGNGGQGYGVVLQFSTSSSLVEDNIFEKLRHSVLLQAGANGNVVAYNYSTKPYWTDVSLPEDAAGELVLHGNYNFANLFEGNEVGNIVIDFSHGKNGYHNTFLNNTATSYGLLANPGPAADSLNLWNNHMTNTSFLKGNFIVYGENNSLSGNKKGSKQTENNANFGQIASLYTSNTHALDVDEELPSKSRYKAGNFTLCSAFNAPDEKSTSVKERSSEFSIYPNPSSHIVNVRADAGTVASIELFTLKGKLIQKSTERSLLVNDLEAGLYILRIIDTEGQFQTKKLQVQ